MTSFHPFPQLPWELRAQIWEMAVEPRNVSVVLGYNDFKLYSDHPKFELWGPSIWTYTPAPAALHACQEARNHLQGQRIYEQAFSITPTVQLKDCPVTPRVRGWRYRKKPRRDVVDTLDVQAEAERARRYVWVNLNIDVINIRGTRSSAYKDFDGEKIQRLQAMFRSTGFKYFGFRYLDAFPNLRELYIECRIGDVENWVNVYKELDELVGAENVWLIPHRIDPGIFKTTITLAKMREELHEFWRREEEKRERSGDGYHMGQPLIEMSAPDGE